MDSHGSGTYLKGNFEMSVRNLSSVTRELV
jgi:hypothetical protein